MISKSDTENRQEHRVAPERVVLDYQNGVEVSALQYVAVQLGLPDLLKDGPKHVQELAVATNTHQPSLYRLLRALAYLNIFVEVEPETFGPTEVSAYLCSDRPDSLYFSTKVFGQEWIAQSWNHLEYSIRTGKAALEHVLGTDVWSYMNAHPEQGQLFDQAMTGYTEVYKPYLVGAYDFSRFGTVVDLGGGQGSLLKTILSRYPHLQGILFDQPSVIESARQHIEPSLQERLQLVSGDLLKGAVPEGGDVYMLKAVLHDWDDEACINILRNCRRAMKPEARLLVIDPVIIPGARDKLVPAEFLDIMMLVFSAGSERTAEQFEHLLTSSGFKLNNVITTDIQFSIVEAIPV